MTVTENKDWLRSHLIYFDNMRDCIMQHGSEEQKNMAIGPMVDRYLQEQIAEEEVWKDLAEAERRINLKNKRVLKAIKSIKGKGFYRKLMDEIEESEGIVGEIEIIKQPKGKYQECSGRLIPGIWVEQWGVGMEGDSWNGTICVQIKPNKYILWNFSM